MLKTEIEVETRAILKELEEVRIDPPDPRLEGGLRDIKNKAGEILKDCSGPIKLGILGAFSAGKTRLIEALLGLANRLRTGEIPSTGNIVEFHCKAVPGLTQSEFGKFDEQTGQFVAEPERSEVVFVTLDEARRFLEHLRGEALSMFTNPEDARTREALSEVPLGDWDRWRTWAEKVYQNERRYKHKYLAFEAFRFAQAYQACGAALNGRTITLTDKTATDNAVSLPTTPGRAADAGLPRCPASLLAPPKNLSADQMAGLFPLVRMVRLKVGVPEPLGRVFQGERDQPFVLVDCPGLGAEESTLRDKFLCLRELHSVESMLIVVDSRNPGGDGAVVLHDMMRDAWNEGVKDRIIVAISRFDQVVGDSNPTSKQAAEVLAGSTEPLTVEELLRVLYDPLGKLVASGLKPLEEGRPDRLTIVSSTRALWVLKNKHPNIVLGDPGFASQMFTEGAVRSLDELTGLWKRIAQRLRAGEDARKPQTHWLHDYADDGGLSRLTATCRKHLDEHGEANLVGKLENALIDLRTEKTRFDRALGTRPGRRVEKPAAVAFDVRGAALRLSRIYGAMVSELEAQGLKPLSFLPPERIDRVGVFEYVREECIDAIGAWEEWRLLFNHVDPMQGPGRIKVVVPPGELPADQDQDAPRRRRLTPSKPIPTRTDDFFEPFKRAMLEVETLARKAAEESVGLLLEDHASRVRRELGQQASSVEKWVKDPGLEDRLAAAGVPSEETLFYDQTLSDAVDPRAFSQLIVERCLTPSGGRDGEEFMRSMFPLALTSRDGKRIGRVFHWDRVIDQKYGTQLIHGRHQIHVIRNRQALEESAVFHARRVVEGYRRAVRERLIGEYRSLETDLTNLANVAR